MQDGWPSSSLGSSAGLGWRSSSPGCSRALAQPSSSTTVTPHQEAARPWNTFAGHGIGAAAAFLSLALFGALHVPSAMIGGQVTASRIAASALAVALTIGGQIPARAGHAPATATTLLITLGGFPADLATLGTLVIGIGLVTLLCDWGRQAVSSSSCTRAAKPAGSRRGCRTTARIAAGRKSGLRRARQGPESRPRRLS